MGGRSAEHAAPPALKDTSAPFSWPIGALVARALGTSRRADASRARSWLADPGQLLAAH